MALPQGAWRKTWTPPPPRCSHRHMGEPALITHKAQWNMRFSFSGRGGRGLTECRLSHQHEWECCPHIAHGSPSLILQPGAENGPGCDTAACARGWPPARQGVVDGQIPLATGGFRCVGRVARPLFACPAVMPSRMRQFEAHCQEPWTRRLARTRAGWQEMFPLDSFPPAGPGLQPLRPFQRLPRRRVQRDRQGAGEGGAGRATPCAACSSGA